MTGLERTAFALLAVDGGEGVRLSPWSTGGSRSVSLVLQDLAGITLLSWLHSATRLSADPATQEAQSTEADDEKGD